MTKGNVKFDYSPAEICTITYDTENSREGSDAIYDFCNDESWKQFNSISIKDGKIIWSFVKKTVDRETK